MRLLCCVILIAGCSANVVRPGITTPCAVAGESTWLDVPADIGGYGLTLSAGGGIPHRIQIDTGSTGVVLRRSTIGTSTPVPSPPQQYIYYNSSGRTMCGQWVVTDLTLTDADRTSVPIPDMQVLAVDYVCQYEPGPPPPKPCGCAPEPLPEKLPDGQPDYGPAMLGIGFDRGVGMGTPAQNPFLQLPDMIRNEMQRGYVITTAGIRLGMRPQDIKGFEFVNLSPLQAPEQWQQAPGCVSIQYGGTVTPSQPVCGEVLMDTGVDRMYLTYRNGPVFAPPLPDDYLWNCTPDWCAVSSGTAAVQVTWPGIGYSYRPSPSPNGFRWRRATPVFAKIGKDATRNIDVFVNTSRQLLVDADYLYDATCGRIGFAKSNESRAR